MRLEFVVLILGLIAVVIGAPIVTIVMVSGMRDRVARLEREVLALRDRLLTLERGPATITRQEMREQPPVGSETIPATPPVPPKVATLRHTPAPPDELPPITTLPPPAYDRPLGSLPRFSLEDIVGGRLPIWIGGAALVLAGFFLVRYSIESGLLGPIARVMLAAIFSLLLIAASEGARRFHLTRDDPRVGQVLAGAGVASAYGTLYIAAAQYHLVGPAAGFAIMAAITGAALFLALRHGPPTAVMALIGGFVAPLIAGFNASGVGPLLVYLGLFVAALFGLAIRRGWVWLAIAAVAAAFGWANLIEVMLEGQQAGAVAAFVVALAIAASLTLPAAGASGRWLRLGPLVAGLIQLLVLAPVLDFSWAAWGFYLMLSAAAMLLSWRDAKLLPSALASAVLVVVLIAAGLTVSEHGVTPTAAMFATLLFGGAGVALSLRAREWALIGVIGLAGPVLASHALAHTLLSPAIWTALELALAVAALALAWRHRDRAGARDAGLIGGTAAAALLAGIGLATLVPYEWASVPVAAVMVALALWARRVADDGLVHLPGLALAALVLLALPQIEAIVELLGDSLTGGEFPFSYLPPLTLILLRFGVPAAAMIALLLIDRTAFAHGRTVAGGIAAAFATITVYALAKQPLHIVTAADLIGWGFTERAVITVLFVGAGWLAWRRTGFELLGNILAGIGLARIVWFDIGVLDPIAVSQHVGPAPIANAAVLLPAAAALLTVQRSGIWRLASLSLSALASAAAVRQIAHGSILTGDLGSTENWGYSAAFLLLSIAWLWRGITTGSRTLRSAGLGLLTIVTLKVFLIDVASSAGILRILALLGLGIALIGIGWGYRRVFPGGDPAAAQPSP